MHYYTLNSGNYDTTMTMCESIGPGRLMKCIQTGQSMGHDYTKNSTNLSSFGNLLPYQMGNITASKYQKLLTPLHLLFAGPAK